jgi:CRISPR-associated protein Cmr4
MSQGQFLFLHAQTGLHPGAGTSLGVIDLPVQRERHTDWPTIPGSTLKGVMRDACRQAHNGKAREADNDPELTAAFGPPTERAHEHAGALTLTDARILAFPVRSLCGVFAWITCPAVVERLGRDLSVAGGSLTLAVPAVENDRVLCAEKSPLLAAKDSIVLEEFDFSRVGDPPSPLVDFIASAVHESAAPRVRDHLAVLSDDDFGYFVRRATEVVARVALEYDRKTVRQGALFYQEFLPAETVFYALAIASASRRDSDATDANGILQYLADRLPPVLQLGGDESIGKGICFARLEEAGGK